MDQRFSVNSTYLVRKRLSRSGRLVSRGSFLLGALLFLSAGFHRLDAQTTETLSGTVTNPSNVPVTARWCSCVLQAERHAGRLV